MATAVQLEHDFDNTNVVRVFRSSVVLVIVQAVVVLAISQVNRLDGPANRALSAVFFAAGALFTIFYPGVKTRARTIEGIAGAAGIGLGATWLFVFVDAFILQPLHTYTNRWLTVGGGSNWWYLPVWWMVGTYLSWMGGWILANQTRRSGQASVPMAAVLLAVTTAICGAGAAILGFPGAGWNVPTFAIAVLPGLLLANGITLFGASRSS
ncbi:MAG TPA: hypothetical protein VHW65_10290 [Gemmatimonadales bacterium]|jgi:hypothetical protein|nr:hypothetical protein [Gemmatimonadales bacterium]